jgi:hypothetical protein
MTDMEDPNYGYTKDQIKKHLILLEDHMKANPCPDCVNKHITAVEGYAEEGLTLAQKPGEQVSFFDLAAQMRNARKKFNEIVE